ncbi:MAG: hypothetical protein CFE26_19015 [Verrucomicrobiales bacterium VVV1]|nr:MAG: hypothetical protein CFE26_19015 [Verrucomicrobiales bacterium VVV1]
MKIAGSIGVLVLTALIALLATNKHGVTSISEARTKIEELQDSSSLELVETKNWSGDAVLGGGVEKKFRSFLHLRDRTTPFVMDDYHFRSESGMFIIQIMDKMGQDPEVVIYTAPNPSTETGKMLRSAFPDAIFSNHP